MIKKAQNIAIRTFFSNVNGTEQEAYEHLYHCDRPLETYIDDHCNGKPFQPWGKFELESVDKMQELIEDLVNDIVSQFIIDNNPDAHSQTVDNWEIASWDNQYMTVVHKDHPGTVQIKADDNGYVVDIFPDYESEESLASTYCEYNDLEDIDDDDM